MSGLESGRRLDVKQAAEVLGISSEGVRKRIKRGSLLSEKGSDGKVWVWLEDPDADRTGSDEEADGDRTGSEASANGDRTQGRTGTDAVLTEALRDQVAMLQAELEDWKGVVTTRDEELRRKDHIIAALTERIPELPAPVASEEASDGRETAPGGLDRVDLPREPQEPLGRRSWLLRWFGF